MAINAIRGTAGNDWLYGTGQNDLMFGGAGDDVFDGGAGGDKMWGEAGNDTFMGGAGADIMYGGSGSDTVDYTSYVAPYVLVNVNLKTGQASGGNAEGDVLVDIENLIGTSTHGIGDVLTGNDNNNILDGRGGRDTLSGGFGNDTLIGGAGDDTMSGGRDADTFIFNANWGIAAVHGDQNDVITDFQVGIDVLTFVGNGVNSLADLSFTQVGGDTVMAYGANSVTLQDVSFEQLRVHQAHDFAFV